MTHQAPLGRHHQVAGKRLLLHRSGSGSPTVVFLPGAGAVGLDYLNVQERAAELTTSVLYDRAGTGWSEHAELPRTAAFTRHAFRPRWRVQRWQEWDPAQAQTLFDELPEEVTEFYRGCGDRRQVAALHRTGSVSAARGGPRCRRRARHHAPAPSRPGSAGGPGSADGLNRPF